MNLLKYTYFLLLFFPIFIGQNLKTKKNFKPFSPSLSLSIKNNLTEEDWSGSDYDHLRNGNFFTDVGTIDYKNNRFVDMGLFSGNIRAYNTDGGLEVNFNGFEKENWISNNRNLNSVLKVNGPVADFVKKYGEKNKVEDNRSWFLKNNDDDYDPYQIKNLEVFADKNYEDNNYLLIGVRFWHDQKFNSDDDDHDKNRCSFLRNDTYTYKNVKSIRIINHDKNYQNYTFTPLLEEQNKEIKVTSNTQENNFLKYFWEKDGNKQIASKNVSFTTTIINLCNEAREIIITNFNPPENEKGTVNFKKLNHWQLEFNDQHEIDKLKIINFEGSSGNYPKKNNAWPWMKVNKTSRSEIMKVFQKLKKEPHYVNKITLYSAEIKWEQQNNEYGKQINNYLLKEFNVFNLKNPTQENILLLSGSLVVFTMIIAFFFFVKKRNSFKIKKTKSK